MTKKTKYSFTTTFDEIAQTIQETIDAGKPCPNGGSGMLKYGPLEGKVTGMALNSSIANGYHGLKKGVYTNLFDFCVKNGFKKPKPPAKEEKPAGKKDFMRLGASSPAPRAADLILQEGLSRTHHLTEDELQSLQYGS